jgi:hypothetical protein
MIQATWDAAQARIAELEADKEAMRHTITHQTNIIEHDITNEGHLRQRAEQAEAELAALKAENERLLRTLDGVRGQRLHWMNEADKVLAELRKMKLPRCETCGCWYAHEFKCEHREAPPDMHAEPDFACNRWAARAEEGGES